MRISLASYFVVARCTTASPTGNRDWTTSESGQEAVSDELREREVRRHLTGSSLHHFTSPHLTSPHLILDPILAENNYMLHVLEARLESSLLSSLSLPLPLFLHVKSLFECDEDEDDDDDGGGVSL